MRRIVAVGLMSGTSMDGIDAALIATDGEEVEAFGPTGFRPYAEAERAVLRQALAAATTLSDRTARPGVLAEAERIVTDAHAETVEQLLARQDVDAVRVTLVGFHGQTVFHAPERRLTIQIGDGAALAKRLGIAVVHDSAPPTSPPAGRARRWCRSSTRRWCARQGSPATSRS